MIRGLVWGRLEDGEDVFGVGANAVVGVGLGEEDGAGRGDDEGGGRGSRQLWSPLMKGMLIRMER